MGFTLRPGSGAAAGKCEAAGVGTRAAGRGHLPRGPGPGRRPGQLGWGSEVPCEAHGQPLPPILVAAAGVPNAGATLIPRQLGAGRGARPPRTTPQPRPSAAHTTSQQSAAIPGARGARARRGRGVRRVGGGGLRSGRLPSHPPHHTEDQHHDEADDAVHAQGHGQINSRDLHSAHREAGVVGGVVGATRWRGAARRRPACRPCAGSPGQPCGAALARGCPTHGGPARGHAAREQHACWAWEAGNAPPWGQAGVATWAGPEKQAGRWAPGVVGAGGGRAGGAPAAGEGSKHAGVHRAGAAGLAHSAEAESARGNCESRTAPKLNPGVCQSSNYEPSSPAPGGSAGTLAELEPSCSPSRVGGPSPA